MRDNDYKALTNSCVRQRLCLDGARAGGHSRASERDDAAAVSGERRLCRLPQLLFLNRVGGCGVRLLLCCAKPNALAWLGALGRRQRLNLGGGGSSGIGVRGRSLSGMRSEQARAAMVVCARSEIHVTYCLQARAALSHPGFFEGRSRSLSGTSPMCAPRLRPPGACHGT